ncbi:MAG TPA: hypothetical protein VGG28_34270 [Kofleriaceae bacterium]|jgi:hypothetical protein
MRSTPVWIATAVVLAYGSQAESKPGQLGTFTCKLVASNAPCADSTDHFDAAVPGVHVTFTTPELPKPGNAYVIQWIATDVGAAAPANTVIATVNEPVGNVVAAAKSYTVNGSLTKPTHGWPVGTYRVEIKLGDKLVTTAKFAIQ